MSNEVHDITSLPLSEKARALKVLKKTGIAVLATTVVAAIVMVVANRSQNEEDSVETPAA